MQGQLLYDYAIIRVVPRVEREEFINVGVIICGTKSGFLQVKLALNDTKLLMLDPEVDVSMIKENLASFEKICSGSQGPIGTMDKASRFRWLTAVRSSIIQTSRPHSGFSDNLDTTLLRLFNEYVL
ncbi:DUF3037 domain-containing protein [Echinicola strongylocentroti]|uniref:DUF3037 domain-containing protein n=1 Tax=Echinicola strongylocentroti TaxID=1795355 RepID=A0A2Z4IIJ9_9BACT|nr:DUF3037 domain-containing protein [Echinicola strongylocentroti]AWW30253.1 DUF3037 domain-containing protein [Echinicola strongylocentroti]